MSVDKLLGDKLFTIKKGLTPDECNILIAKANGKGWKKSPPTGGGHGRNDKEIPRTSSLCVLYDTELAKKLGDIIKPHLPPNLTYLNHKDNPYLHGEYQGAEWSPAFVYDKMRLYQYFPGDSFPEHHDYKIRRRIITEDNEIIEQSFTSLLIYLNDDFEDGQTGYWPDEIGLHCRYKKDVDEQSSKRKTHQILVTPEPGKIVLQYQDMMHEGISPKKGVKYLLRTDVIYRQKIVRPNKLKFKPKPSIGEWERVFEPSCKNYAD
jgi:hypothetical protein